MNPYCQALGIAVPRLEDVAERREASNFTLLVVALLERGGPMTLAQVAARFEEAGIAPAAWALLSLKRCRPGRRPVYRTGDEYALDPHDDEAHMLAFRVGLIAPKVLEVPEPAPRPAPAPIRGLEQPLTLDELREAWKGASLHSAWSAQRIATAVLEAHGRPMAAAEVVSFVEGLASGHSLRGALEQFGRRGSAIQVGADGRWVLDPGHVAVRAARKSVRERLAMVRRWEAQQGRPEEWQARQEAYERQRAVRGAELASLRRVLVHAFPAAQPELVAVLNVSTPQVETLLAREPAVRARLDAADVIAGVQVRAVLRALAYPHEGRRLHELGPPRQALRVGGRVVRITLDLVVRSSCGIERPFADPERLRGWWERQQLSRLRGRLEEEAKTLYALYEYGRLHGAVRVVWGKEGAWLPVPWVNNEEIRLRGLMEQAVQSGRALEVVAGPPPEWPDPWAEAWRCTVRGGPHPWNRWLEAEGGLPIPEDFVHRARLAPE